MIVLVVTVIRVFYSFKSPAVQELVAFVDEWAGCDILTRHNHGLQSVQQTTQAQQPAFQSIEIEKRLAHDFWASY
jgi:hypothetical protein